MRHMTMLQGILQLARSDHSLRLTKGTQTQGTTSHYRKSQNATLNIPVTHWKLHSLLSAFLQQASDTSSMANVLQSPSHSLKHVTHVVFTVWLGYLLVLST